MPAPPQVQFVQGTAPGLPAGDVSVGAAAYDPATRSIYYQKGALDRMIRGHETGHAFDQQALDSANRLRFEQVMGLGKGRWNQGTGQAGANSPDEWFADYYSAAVNNVDPRHFSEASYATNINRPRLKAFEKLLAQIGREQQLPAY